MTRPNHPPLRLTCHCGKVELRVTPLGASVTSAPLRLLFLPSPRRRHAHRAA